MLQTKTHVTLALLWTLFAAFAPFCPDAFSVEAARPSVRLALVNIPDDLVRPLLPAFLEQTGLSADIVYTGSDPFSVARAGKADLVIAHYGHVGVERFVSDGFGLWPHPVFANQMVLLGPSGDPAQVRGLADAVAAFARIAETKSTFVANDNVGAKYLEEVLWRSAKVVPKGDWYLELKVDGKDAVDAAARRGAYVLWGIAPFLRQKAKRDIALEPLVVGDPLLQRIMVSIVVNPAKVQDVDETAAKTFERFLIAPATQAQIRGFRYPGVDQQVWWPAGRHNSAKD